MKKASEKYKKSFADNEACTAVVYLKSILMAQRMEPERSVESGNAQVLLKL